MIVHSAVASMLEAFGFKYGLPPIDLFLPERLDIQLQDEVRQGLTAPGEGWPAKYYGMVIHVTPDNPLGDRVCVRRGDRTLFRDCGALAPAPMNLAPAPMNLAPAISWASEAAKAIGTAQANVEQAALQKARAPQDNRNDAMTGEKPSNPKDIIGSDKLPLHLWPSTATAMGCLAFLEGALKYGRSNWRAVGVRASIYTDAAKRHIDAWFEGEEVSPDTGTPHLSSALACLAILVDAAAHGKLQDDRAYAERGSYRLLVDKLTPHVKALKDQFKDKHPKHYTISDKVSE